MFVCFCCHRLRWRCGLKSLDEAKKVLIDRSPPSLAVWIEIDPAQSIYLVAGSPPSLAVWIEI